MLNFLKKIRKTPEYELLSDARDAFIAETIKISGDDLRAACRSLHPEMEDEFVELYIRDELARMFWRATRAIEAHNCGLKITRR